MKWSALMEFQVWSRYWTLFWPKYCARAGPADSNTPAAPRRAARAQAPEWLTSRRTLFTAGSFLPGSTAGARSRLLDGCYTRSGGGVPRPVKPGSVFPARLQVHVVVGGRGQRVA